MAVTMSNRVQLGKFKMILGNSGSLLGKYEDYKENQGRYI